MSKGVTGKKSHHPYVTVDPKIGKGNPVVKGTRTKVIDIAIRYDLMGTSADQIVEQLPHLDLAQVHDALSYYYENKSELDSQSQKDRTLVAELKAQYASRLKINLG